MAATSQNIIRTLTIKSTVEGADKTKADLKGIQSAHEGLAKTTETSAKHQLSLQKSFEQSERRFNTALRSQQDFEKVQRQVNAAVAQNPALQARANEVLRLAGEHFGKAAAGQTLFARGMQAANDNMQSFALRAGPVGSILSSFGPAGVAAAVGIGVLTLGFHQAATAALALADRAGKLKDFAETTGFTIIQLQALEKAGAQVGVSSESVTKGLERFSRQMVDVRKATGETYDQLARVDIGLARQVSRTENLADAWDLVSKAIKAAPLEQANKIAVAFFGREGIQQTRLMRAGADVGGIAGLVDQLKEIDRILPEQAKRWDDLGDTIAENMKAAKQNFTSVFADSVLQSLKEMSEVLLVASREAKGFDWSEYAAFFKRAEQVLPVLTLLRALTRPANTGVTHGLTSPQAASALGGMSRGGGNKPDKESTDIVRRLADETIRLSNEEKKRMEALGGAATANEKRVAKEKEIAALIAEYPHLQQEATRQLADFNREAASSALSARIGLLGDMADVEDVVRQKLDAINRANKDGAGITAEQTRALLEKTRVQAEAVGPDAQIRIQREAIFLLEEEAQIRQQLLSWGVRWNSAEGERLAQGLRFNNQLKEVKDIATTALSGFAKDIANGVKPMDALLNQAKRLQDIFIDMAAKRVVAEAMGSVFGAAVETAGSAAGATTAAGILTAAGAALAAEMVSGATAAAAILGIGGATSGAAQAAGGTAGGTAAAAGGAAGGTALAVGGTTAATAIYGPLALLMVAIAAAAAVIGLGGNSAEKERQRAAIQGYRDRATLARTDTSTLAGSLSEFDMRANAERAALPNGGLTQKSWTNTLTFGLFGDKGGNPTQELTELIKAQDAERLRLIEDFGKKAIEAEKQAAAERLQLIDDFGRAMNELKGKSFLNDFADLAKQISAYQNAGVGSDQINEFRKLSAQKIVDDAELTGAAFDGLLLALPELAGVVHEFTSTIRRSASEIAEEAVSLQDRILRAVTDSSTLDGALVLFDITAQREREEQARKGGENIALLESALAAERLNILKDFNQRMLDEQVRAQEQNIAEQTRLMDEQARAQEENIARQEAAMRRGEDLQTRILRATTDASTLDGALLLFDRAAKLEREAAIREGGENIIMLEAALAAERANVITEFNQRLIDEQQRLFDDAVNYLSGALRNIQQYLDNLTAGSQSPLAPEVRLAEAQSQYAAQLALAQGGDRDALNSITSYADRLLDAAKAQFASSPEFQAIFEQIRTQLGGLSGQLSPEQFIVNGFQDAITTFQTNLLGNLNANFATIDANLDGKLTKAEMIQALGITEAAAVAIVDRFDRDGDGMLALAELTAENTVGAGLQEGENNSIFGRLGILGNKLGFILDHVDELDAADGIFHDIEEIRSQFVDTTPGNPFASVFALQSPLPGTPEVSGMAVDLLRKIVWNTAAIALNTHASLSHENLPVLGAGGLIGGNPHANGGTMIEAERGEFMMSRMATARLGPDVLSMMNRTGRLPHAFGAVASNDNSTAIIAVLERNNAALIMRLEQLEHTIERAEHEGSSRVREGVDKWHVEQKRQGDDNRRIHTTPPRHGSKRAA